MRRNIERSLVAFLVLFSLLGCSKSVSTNMEEKFREVVSVNDLNKSIELKVDDNKDVFPNGYDIPILAQNKSPYFLFLNLEENYIRLFTIRDAEWVEIKNGLTYSGSRILSPHGNALLDLEPTWARPEVEDAILEDNKTEVLVRIVMTGEIMEKDKPSGKFIGAYVDVYVRPTATADSPE